MRTKSLFAADRFRILSNVTRLCLIPPVIGVAISEAWQGSLAPKTGPTLYLITGLTTVMVGMAILTILGSNREDGIPYRTPLLQALIEGLEAFIHRVCLILKYPSLLMVVLSAIFAPIWALFTKADEYQGMPVAILPQEAVDVPIGTMIGFIVMILTTSGYEAARYRSFKALKHFDEFMRRPYIKGEKVYYIPIFMGAERDLLLVTCLEKLECVHLKFSKLDRSVRANQTSALDL